jgi:DNA-binding response OmpR family regulator
MIVVMHHHMEFRKALVRFLQVSGFDTVGFPDGGEGMRVIRRQRPQLLILNGTLSDMDGIEMLQQLRADEALSDLSVYFLSCDFDKKPEAQRLGISEYFLKPLDLQEFLRCVQGTCRSLDDAGIKTPQV